MISRPSPISLLSPELKSRYRVAIYREQENRRSTNRLAAYRPYPKQQQFHAAGAGFRERLFMAGNQLGKTLAGSFEEAIHAVGLYPDWWTGRRFEGPTVSWCAGVTQLSARDTVQRLLLGRPGSFGTGAIPKDLLLDWSMARSVPDLVDTIHVRHSSGGISLILLKSYEQGRQKWQGETLHRVWFDEEPPEDIYLEGLTRTNATGGMVSLTFTPLLGVSNVVRRFLFETSTDRHVTQMSIEEAEHYSVEERTRIIATYPPHEREARTKGVPVLGSGRIFPVMEEAIAVEPFAVPKRWKWIGGVDFGWDHPFAAVKLAWDADADIVYVTQCYRAKEATPVIHAAALRGWGSVLKWAWPHDGLQHDKGSGEQLAEQYRNQGLALLPERATFEDGTSGLEAGISEMLIRMETGRWKVFRHLTEWFEEFRLYHRKDGRVVKELDDLLSASRYAMMMLRHAAPESGLWDAPISYDSRGII